MTATITPTNGPISIALSRSLVRDNNQDVAMGKFEQQSQEAPPTSLNAWTGAYEQKERGLIINNQT